MSSISVRPVVSKADQKQFLNLPWRIYADDPNWTPPLLQNEKELVGYAKHPFYERNEVQTFLAFRGSKVVGRVAAILNRGHIERFDEPVGFFGFFEADDDVEISRALFDAVKEWLAERDATTVRGPANPSLNYECGLLIDGFDKPATFMMTYNPPYYPHLIEAAGFEKSQNMYAFWGHVEMLAGLDKKMSFVIEEAVRRFEITTRRMNTKRFNEEVRMFLDIYNQSLGGTWGFVPMSEGEIDHMSNSLKHLIAPEMTSVAEVDGKPIGAVFALLDYNPRIKQMGGRLFPFGFIRLLWNKRKIKKVRMMSTNVVPAYQRWGAGLVVMARLVPEVLDWGIEEVEFSWVLESNHLSYKTLKRGGAIVEKTYRIYDWKSDDA